MKIRTDITKCATLGVSRYFANILLVSRWVVDNLLFGVCHLTAGAILTMIEADSSSPVVSILDRDNIRAHLSTVGVSSKIATKPASTDFNVRETTKIVVVRILLCAESCSEHGKLIFVHLSEEVVLINHLFF